MPEGVWIGAVAAICFIGESMDKSERVDELEERYDFDYEIGEDNIHP
jgi:hypothetical protein